VILAIFTKQHQNTKNIMFFAVFGFFNQFTILF